MYADMEFPQEKGKIMKVNAIILNRSNRKFWYVRYQMFFENLDVTEGEESTKVLKNEKDLKFMQQKYLPAWIFEKQNSFTNKNIATKNFEYYAKMYLKECEQYYDYDNMYYRTSRILKEFGTMEIAKITKHKLKVWLNGLKNLHNNEDLSKKSKLKYLTVIHKIFEIACDDNILEKNWTYEIKLAGQHQSKHESVKPFSTDEVRILLNASKDIRYGSLLHDYLGIAFNEGMSPHEILALKIQDINLVKMTMKIERGITKNKVKETKTLFRHREIPIFESTEIYILNLIKRAKELNSEWLFCTEDAKHLRDVKAIRGDRMITKNNCKIKQTTKWYKLIEDTGIEYRDLKNCRHTFAVRAIESKRFTLQEIANILGHSDLKMLLEHYAKWISDKALSADRSIKLF